MFNIDVHFSKKDEGGLSLASCFFKKENP